MTATKTLVEDGAATCEIEPQCPKCNELWTDDGGCRDPMCPSEREVLDAQDEPETSELSACRKSLADMQAVAEKAITKAREIELAAVEAHQHHQSRESAYRECVEALRECVNNHCGLDCKMYCSSCTPARALLARIGGA